MSKQIYLIRHSNSWHRAYLGHSEVTSERIDETSFISIWYISAVLNQSIRIARYNCYNSRYYNYLRQMFNRYLIRLSWFSWFLNITSDHLQRLFSFILNNPGFWIIFIPRTFIKLYAILYYLWHSLSKWMVVGFTRGIQNPLQMGHLLRNKL